MEKEQTRTRSRERTRAKVHVYTEHYTTARVFTRAVESMRYTLTQERQNRLASVPRVFHPELGEGTSENWNIVDPGDEPFRTQSLNVHFVTVQAGGRNDGHGHQNEALFYVLEGHGYEMHDGVRYDWSQGDAVAVHNDCVHWHNNADDNNRAVCLVMKPKAMYLFLGLWQQGKVGTVPEDDSGLEPPTDWIVAKPEGDELLPKVLTPNDTPWEWTPQGYVRRLAGAGVPLRIKATDAYLQEIPGGSRSGKRWQMADEVVYVRDGSGYSLHWDVDVEITDRYHARIAKQPTRWEWNKGDVVWIPHNTVVQHFNSDASKPVTLVAAQNRIYQYIGYSRVVHLENAPEYDAQKAGRDKVTV